ncbi:hypothetical protein F7725_014235 [Dissostichus mawsoni]|uniref:Proline dehydrogenase n=1 Tax=Dissostichus mawsoni TaxID=36200 RepID=A0A7J5YYH3_DISMA|nr:hypothetical protein F7725_014235 [Dissostichus mawsoni]
MSPGVQVSPVRSAASVRDGGFCLGVKLVRGAYMDKERKLAEKQGRPTPYNGSLDVMLEDISKKPESYRIIVATHNEESLLGMCDHVSLTLAKEGYAVYKSVPYGSVDDTLPYLVRRAQENQTGIRKERDLLRKELFRRLTLRAGRS